jgi:hypothetical protein
MALFNQRTENHKEIIYRFDSTRQVIGILILLTPLVIMAYILNTMTLLLFLLVLLVMLIDSIPYYRDKLKANFSVRSTITVKRISWFGSEIIFEK